MKDYAAIAHDYAMAAAEGRVDVSKWVRLTCKRHLDDLAKSSDPAYPYRFSSKKAARVCQFAEMLPVGGRQAGPGKTLKLQPWQVFVLACTFGWLEKATKYRRFRTVMLYVPRKNGKSFLSAVVGLYCLLMDGEQHAEVYCGATTEPQARKVWTPAAVIIRKCIGLRELGVKQNKDSITVPATESKMTTVIGQPLDGDNPSCALLDEAHQWHNDMLLTAMQTGMGERPQPLTWITTTAGYNLAGPAKLMQDDLQDVLQGTKTDDRLFGVLYGLDPEDDWTSEAAIYKANPNVGVSVRFEYLRDQQAKAVQNKRLQTAVKTKHFNIWCNAAVSWMDMERWAKCGDSQLKLEDFKGEPAIAAFDLAEVKDLTAYVLLFKRLVGELEHYYLFSRFYLPSARIDDPENAHYRQWHANGYLESVPGEVNTHEDLKAQILEDSQAFEIREIAHDPYRAHKLVAELIDHGLTCAVVDQGWRGMSEPMKELESLVLSGRLHHSNSPVMNWCIANTVARPVRGDNIVPEKTTAERKIDGTDAALMTLAREMVAPLVEVDPTSAADFFMFV
jgi:phage terminase large subunit-like protein